MKQPWIYSARVDGAFILAPALLITAAILFFQDGILHTQTLSPWMWGLLIIGVDVSHVYSTLFRTYSDKQELSARPALYALAPLLGWLCGALLYSLGSLVFWRAIAYLAVFHFMRQQYGFMMIYGRKERLAPAARLLDKAAIYMATLYPLIYWHTHMPRRFDWFVEGDFFPVSSPLLASVSLAVYASVMSLYVAKECWRVSRTRDVNIPKNLLLAGTALSWWAGIVYFNNDLAFTGANVLAHGIPYMALIWIYGRNQSLLEPEKHMFGMISWRRFFSVGALPLFLVILFALAYLEEGLWDGFVWTEHKGMFGLFHHLPVVEDKATLTWLVPLLALPQITHYLLDAFIWRMKSAGTNWKAILFHRSEQAL